jgi:hypothetical protein
MNFFARAFSSAGGTPSSMRVLTGFVVLCIMGSHLYLTIKTGVKQNLTLDEVAIVVSALGVKAWQRGRETTAAIT